MRYCSYTVHATSKGGFWPVGNGKGGWQPPLQWWDAPWSPAILVGTTSQLGQDEHRCLNLQTAAMQFPWLKWWEK